MERNNRRVFLLFIFYIVFIALHIVVDVSSITNFEHTLKLSIIVVIAFDGFSVLFDYIPGIKAVYGGVGI